MSCGVGHRCGSDLVLLWLWYRPAAVALIRPLAWEHPHATSMGLKRQKRKRKKKEKVLHVFFFFLMVTFILYFHHVDLSFDFFFVLMATHMVAPQARG